jgi:hypothetical protein
LDGEEIYDHAKLVFRDYPAYPFLIAAGISIGANPVIFAGIIPIILYALLIFPLFILGKIIINPLAGYIACIICVFSSQLLDMSSWAHTDMPYLFLSILAILFISIYVRCKSIGFILFAGIIGMLAAFTRIIGISLILTGMFFIIITNINNYKKLISHLICYCLISILPLIIWMAIVKDYCGTYTILRVLPNSMTIIQYLNYFIHQARATFYTGSEIIVSISTILFAVSILIILKKGHMRQYTKNTGVVFTYVFIYTIGLILSTSPLLFKFARVHERYLAQLIPFVVLIIIATFIFAYYLLDGRLIKMLGKSILLFMLAVFLFQQANILINTASDIRSGSSNYYNSWNIIEGWQREDNISNIDTIYDENAHEFILKSYLERNNSTGKRNTNSPNVRLYSGQTYSFLENDTLVVKFLQKLRTDTSSGMRIYLCVPNYLSKKEYREEYENLMIYYPRYISLLKSCNASDFIIYKVILRSNETASMNK